jgi:chromosome segregation ATPase
MKKTLTLLLILSATFASAVEEADPAMAALKRMRDQLRTVMLQQQKTEAERAALAAEKATLEEKAATLEANLKKLAKESNLQKETDSKVIVDLQDKAAKQAAEIVRLQESLAAWKKGHAEVVDAAKKIEAQRAEHAARAILAERKLADASRKNLDLYNLGLEILSKYEGFGLGTAITAREPFTRTMRVKLENYVQDFGDKLEDGKIQPEKK